MKNWRNGQQDTSPPLHHRDLRPCITRIAANGVGVTIRPGPYVVPFMRLEPYSFPKGATMK